MRRDLMASAFSGVVSLGVLFSTCSAVQSAESQAGEILVKSLRGRASYCQDKVNWLPLVPNLVLKQGAILRTEGNSTADVVIKSSGTALRLTSSTLLEVTRLEKEVAGEDLITRTALELRTGALIGSQRKLENPSAFQIQTRAGTVSIRGTKYLVKADGTVRCFSGSISVDDNSVASAEPAIAVPAGFSFDPATKAISAIEPGIMTALITDVNAVHQNAQSLKKDSGQLVMRLEEDKKKVSPTKGNNGVGNGVDPQPPGNPPINDGPGTSPGNPGNKGGTPGHNG